jgi:O-antigen/teichoic acid export membrane protein
MEDSLKKRYIIKLLASLISGLINIIFIAVVPKALGPVSFGYFSYLQQFFTQILAFFDAGTSTAFFTKLSAKNIRKELITIYGIFSLILLLIISFLIFGFNLFNGLDILLPEIPTEYVFLGLYFGFFTWFTQIYIKISDAYALTVSVELIKILHKVLSLILLLSFIHFIAFDLSIYFMFHYISLISFILILSILFIKKDIFTIKIFNLKIAYSKIIKEFYIYASPIFVFNIIAVSVSLFDIWLLQRMSGSIQTGYYGLAYSIATMCFLFTGAMTPIITREFSKSFENNDLENIKILFKRYIPMLYSISAYFGVFISFQSENLLSLFTDEKFKDAYYVLIIMALYPIHQTYGQLNGSLFFSMNQTKLYRNIGIVTSLFGLIFTYFYLYVLEYGAVGFAWKMVLIQIISVNIQLYFNTKHLKINMMPFIRHQGISLLFFCVAAYSTTSLIYPNENGIQAFMINGIIYTVIVIVGTILFPSIFSITKIELNKLLYNMKNRLLGVANGK